MYFFGCLPDTYADDAALAANNLVFLPAAGYRDGSAVCNVGDYGIYWSSTAYDGDVAYGVYFYNYYVDPGFYVFRSRGYSVRLITECQ